MCFMQLHMSPLYAHAITCSLSTSSKGSIVFALSQPVKALLLFLSLSFFLSCFREKCTTMKTTDACFAQTAIFHEMQSTRLYTPVNLYSYQPFSSTVHLIFSSLLAARTSLPYHRDMRTCRISIACSVFFFLFFHSSSYFMSNSVHRLC